MATVKYLIRTQSENAQIYIRFTNGRTTKLQKKTGFVIDSKNWSASTNLPKQNTPENKNLISKLNQLSNYVFDRFNNDISNNVLIDSNWLDNCINTCFNRVEVIDKYVFINFLNEFIENAPTREIRGGKIGLSPGSIKNYMNFKKIIETYQKQIKKVILFTDLNKPFLDKFKTWLLKNYTVNYTGKQLEMIKTICREAQKNEINVTMYSVGLTQIRESNKDKIIHTLSFDEIDKIYNTEMPTPHLREVKKWILIGCYIGQRGGDLVNLKPENLRETSKGLYIDLVQQKTDKHVTIPVGKDYVIDILLNDFPKPVSIDKMNKHISKVCQIAGINEVVEGYHTDGKGKRSKTTVKDFKHTFITSHSLRRSFATNFYKTMPTPILIGITGHTNEETFLEYINQRTDKDANADLFMQYFEQMNRNVEPKMRIIKNKENQ